MRRKLLFGCASAFIVFFASRILPAQTSQYWDIDTIDAAGAGGGGAPSGTWDTATTPNWNVNADGTGIPTTWTDGNLAVFSAGSDATGTYVVTVSGAPQASGITFEEGTDVTLNGGQVTLTGTTPTVTLNDGLNLHVNSVLSGSGGLTTVGGLGAKLFLGGANNYTGNTSIGTDVLSTAAGVIPDGSILTIQNGASNKFELNGNDETVRGISAAGAGAIALGTNTLTINDQTGDSFTYTAQLTSSGTLATAHGKIIKNGPGQLLLNEFGPFNSGEFVLNSGTLAIGQNNIFGPATANAKLTINSNNDPTGPTLKREGTTDCPSCVATINLSVTTIDIDGNFTYDNNGNNDTQLNGSNGASTTTLKADNPVITVINGSRSGGAFIFAGDIVDDGNIRGFTKSGPGTMILGSKGNAYRGETTIQQGFLRVRKQTNTGNVGTARIGDGNGRVNLSGGQLEYNGSVVTAGDPRTFTVTNPINVTAAGSSIGYFSTTATLGATNTIDFIFSSDQITTPGGDLTLKNEGSCTDNSSTCTFRPTFSGTGFTVSIPVTVNNHATVATRTTQLNSTNTTGTQTWSNVISGTGSYRRSGAGATLFTAANTYTGGTIIDGGTLTVQGSSATFGAGDVTVNSGGTAAISAGVANAILDAAKLTLATGGTMSLAAGINERVGSLVLGGVTEPNGTYSASNFPAFFTGTGDVVVGPAGLLGDFNNDGKVDAGDYATWRKNEVANASLPNDNGLATQAARFSLWRANFGNSSGAGSGLSASGVPEPATFVLLGWAVIGFGSIRRRRKE